ncbi:VapC toxin family PIN domain ribonuclease [Candidatus Woesearchaeota archaeon CG10_big_fil_rev_8_21_14_0_10_37_12]|nr:MAG: VapC toxin family PIN domain ribonuclease [Candidatus Woesearchaeota archaeon CG10_big_fil_rev_8_21_14_0_10_37_12]
MTVSKYFMDSSAWLAYFFNANQRVLYLIEKEGILLTSVLSLFEIKRKLIRDGYDKKDIDEVLQFIQVQSIIVELGQHVSKKAAEISIADSLSAIDSIIYTAAQDTKSMLITGDNDFRNLPDVEIIS